MTHILVIDDDPTIRVVLTRSLQKQGYHVAVASNGQEGMEQAYRLGPALIICDWMMPVMDGLEVCRQIKAHPELSNTYFILLTSRGATEDRVVGLDTGADEFLSKPIEINELNARVRAGLRIYQLTQDLRNSKRALEAELAEAADYVRSLLPDPLDTPVAIANRFIPSRQLGGDCFDYYWLDSEHLVIYLLDVAGHGLAATLPSVSVLNLLRSHSQVGFDFTQPASVLTELNQYFQMDLQQDKYFTIWYGVYNRTQDTLLYSSAGHPPALLLSGTPGKPPTLQTLKTKGLPIGMFPEAQYTQSVCHIDTPSTLYVFSDGVYEINQPDGTLWGLDAFSNLLTYYWQKNGRDIDGLLARIRSLNLNPTFDDDFSLLQVEFLE